MLIYFWVGLGGAIGSIFRFFCSTLIGQHWGDSFPWGTLLINISGSFAIGFFATLTASEGRLLIHPSGRIFFMTGVCGGYTTFSAFSLQTLELAQEGNWLYAGAYVMASVFLCLLFVWIGHALAASLNLMKGL